MGKLGPEKSGLSNSPDNQGPDNRGSTVEVVILILYQILIPNLQGCVQQLEGRINNKILGVKGLTTSHSQLLLQP